MGTCIKAPKIIMVKMTILIRRSYSCNYEVDSDACECFGRCTAPWHRHYGGGPGCLDRCPFPQKDKIALSLHIRSSYNH